MIKKGDCTYSDPRCATTEQCWCFGPPAPVATSVLEGPTFDDLIAEPIPGDAFAMAQRRIVERRLRDAERRLRDAATVTEMFPPMTFNPRPPLVRELTRQEREALYEDQQRALAEQA